MAKKVTLQPRKKGQKKVTFRKGGLHKSTGTPAGQKISSADMQKALEGYYGQLAVKQANMAQGMLKKGRKTAVKNKKK